MATIIKGASGPVLSTASNWVGGVVPGAADIARWTSVAAGGAVNSSSGNHTGSLTILGLQINDAAGDVFYTSGTLTLTQTDAFVNGTTNSIRFWVNGGTLALGTANRTLTIYNSVVNPSIGFLTNTLTGSGNITLQNASPTAGPVNAFIAMQTSGTLAAFTGNFLLSDRTGIAPGISDTAVLPNSNVTVNGTNCQLFPLNATNDILGASGKTLTINNDVSLGVSGRTWTIAYAVALGSTTRTLAVLGATTLSGPISGTAGLTKTGASNLQITSASNPVSGTAIVSAGSIVVGTFNSGAPNGLNNLTSVVIDASGGFSFWGANAYTFAVPFSGSGLIGTNNPGTVTLSDAASISGFTGTYQVNADNTVSGKLRLDAFPTNASKLLLQGFTTGSTARTFTIATHHSTAGVTSALVELFANAASTGGVAVLEDNGTASSNFNGNVTNASGSNASATHRLRLTGTNTASTYAGNILATNASGGLGVTKEGTGTWNLSGANTFAGSVLVSAGTLTAKSSGALGATTGAVTVSSGATLTLDGGVTVNKGSTQLTAHASDPITSVGDNTLQFATFPMAATTTFTVGSGNALRLINSGAISGATFGITKAGDGELELGTGASTYTGTCTVSAGTLTVKSMNDQSANGVFGNSTNRVALTGALKFNGSANASTNKVELQGAAPTLDASGTSNATATFTSLAQTNVARTLTLTGSGEGIISATLANSTEATGVTKAGTGLWRLTGPVTIGGAVAVNAGRLRIQTATSNASMTSTVTVGASGILELITDELASSSSTAARVAGIGNMTVSGEVKTRGGVTQKGQVRYGGNLTFQSGSKLYIGAAA